LDAFIRFFIPAICSAGKEKYEGSGHASQITYKQSSKEEPSTGDYEYSASHNAVMENIESNKDGLLEVEYSFGYEVKSIYDN